MALLRTLDPGTMGGDQGRWSFLLAMLAVTIGGIFLISSLIGILTTGLDGRLESLRKGRSRVIETGHTVILGWSQMVFTIVSELIEANSNQKRACIVVLGDKDKIEMEDALREKVKDKRTTRIVCRSGNPIDMADLDIVSLDTAKSVIVLAPEEADPDAQVIKTLLAITNAPGRRPGPYHIVAEIRDPKNLEAAELVGGSEVALVQVGDLIARIIAQTCRQSGLSTVYGELLDFKGDEIYFKTEPALAGCTFGQAMFEYDDSTLIGIQPADGVPRLNPPMDTIIHEADQLIFIAEDDDTIRRSGLTQLAIYSEAIHLRSQPRPESERTLILGWNWRAPTILHELDNYVAPGSEVVVVADDPNGRIAEVCQALETHNHKVSFREGDPTDRHTLDRLGVSTFQHVVVLSYSDVLDVQRADARTLMTLLHLRHIAERCGHPFSIVSEMLDIRNRNLAEVTRADDFIVSDQLISLVLAQVSENRALNAVFADLFNVEGSEIYLKPVTEYVSTGQKVNFYTVLEAARRRGEVAVGYRRHVANGVEEHQDGVVVNPDKQMDIVFSEADRIIVLSEG